MAATNVRGGQIADGANGVDLTVDVTNVLPVANGGTGNTSNVAASCTGNAANVTGTVAIANGGTGATTLAGAAITVGSSNGTPTGLTLWVGTAAQYAAIGSKSSTTVYVVTP